MRCDPVPAFRSAFTFRVACCRTRWIIKRLSYVSASAFSARTLRGSAYRTSPMPTSPAMVSRYWNPGPAHKRTPYPSPDELVRSGVATGTRLALAFRPWDGTSGWNASTCRLVGWRAIRRPIANRSSLAGSLPEPPRPPGGTFPVVRVPRYSRRVRRPAGRCRERGRVDNPPWTQ